MRWIKDGYSHEWIRKLHGLSLGRSFPRGNKLKKFIKEIYQRNFNKERILSKKFIKEIYQKKNLSKKEENLSKNFIKEIYQRNS